MDHETAWADALATEHAHQRELLATLHGELGTFAKECASALTALDSYVSALGGVVAAIDTARTVHAHADLAADLYARFAGDATLPVAQASELLRTEPRRTDRELLQALVAAAGVRRRFEELVGPAPLAALSALAPLARWKESRPTLHEAVDATAKVASAEGAAVVTDAQALAATLHDAVDHVQSAADAVREGRLEQVLAESRAKLEADLDALHAVLHDHDEAPHEWLDARHDEHAELTEEVRTKLDRVERIRRALGLILPHLQTLVRGLAVAERVETVAGHRNELLSALGGVWDAAIPGSSARPPARPRPSRRRLLVGAAVLAAILVALVVALASSGGKSRPTAANAAAPTTAATTSVASTPAAPKVAPAPKLTPVHAEFVEAQRETVYAISATGAHVTYTWRLTPPKDNPGCDKFAPVPGKPTEAVWHHADTDGCLHTGFQHLGRVTVTVSTPDWRCVATFFGTLTKNGPAPQRCRRA